MGGRLEGKKVIATACGQGIGRAAALAFAREGASVLATDINGDLLAQLHDTPGISTHVLDVTDEAEIGRLAGAQEGLDILFNCAGFVHHGSLTDASSDEWDFAFNLNCKSIYRMCREFIPVMEKDGGGAIINMASVASSIVGAPNRFVYGATKAAVIGMTKSIAVDYVGANIRANAICPGTVQSPSLEDRMKAQGDYETARAAFIDRQPMKRLGTAEEIGELAVYLGSDAASFVTGQEFVIDGGWSMA